MTLAPTMADVERDIIDVLYDEVRRMLAIIREREVRQAGLAPTAFDLLGIAQLYRDHPEFALKLATEAGKEFDREHK
jgi:hypothetical protein